MIGHTLFVLLTVVAPGLVASVAIASDAHQSDQPSESAQAEMVTRGGVAVTCHEVAERTGLRIFLEAVPVVLRTDFGSDRPLDMLSGIDLPRIC